MPESVSSLSSRTVHSFPLQRVSANVLSKVLSCSCCPSPLHRGDTWKRGHRSSTGVLLSEDSLSLEWTWVRGEKERERERAGEELESQWGSLKPRFSLSNATGHTVYASRNKPTWKNFFHTVPSLFLNCTLLRVVSKAKGKEEEGEEWLTLPLFAVLTWTFDLLFTNLYKSTAHLEKM